KAMNEVHMDEFQKNNRWGSINSCLYRYLARFSFRPHYKYRRCLRPRRAVCYLFGATWLESRRSDGDCIRSTCILCGNIRFLSACVIDGAGRIDDRPSDSCQLVTL